VNIKLDEQEQELIDSYDRGEWQSIATPENLAKYKQIAQNTSSHQLDDYLPVIIAPETLYENSETVIS
jgi:hypothetical protein